MPRIHDIVTVFTTFCYIGLPASFSHDTCISSTYTLGWLITVCNYHNPRTGDESKDRSDPYTYRYRAANQYDHG